MCHSGDQLIKMPTNTQDSPSLIVEYIDPQEGFTGWLVIDNLNYPMAAGGMRVQIGLTQAHLVKMAHNMTLKMQVCGLPIGGAKCGIAYDPTGKGKKNAMSRFMAAIKPYIMDSYSMGPDLNTSMNELEEIAAEHKIPSVKMAIAQAQGMDLDAFLGRYKVLAQEVAEGWTLGQIRAGYGVAMAAIAVLNQQGIKPNTATAAIQGFGTLAKATIAVLQSHGVTIRAVAEVEKCICTGDGCKILQDKSLLCCTDNLLPKMESHDNLEIQESEEIYSIDCDILILAAIENVITADNAGSIKAKAVIPGANLAVTPEAERLLFQRGVICLPSFIAGCGGSLSMNGLFAPADTPSASEVLNYVSYAMTKMVQETMAISANENIPPEAAAFKYSKLQKRQGKPYDLGDYADAL